MPATLSAIGVTFAYPSSPEVLSAVSLEVERGKVRGIIGPNGSGKSTLLRLLAGIMPPVTGSVLLDASQDSEAILHRIPARARARRLAYLPQSVAPLFGLTVEETVALGRYPHSEGFGGLTARDHDAVERAMARTAVLPLRGRFFAELSGGERQRALLASVLAQSPEFLLLDEPTAALDLHHESEVFALLRELAGEGFGVCVVSHDLSLAAAHCDQVLLLGSEGAPVASGAPLDVLTAEALSTAYGSLVRVGTHPFTGAPLPYAPPGTTP